MGDRRFAQAYDRLKLSHDPVQTLRELDDEGVIQALAHASREHDPYLANVLATEALNRLAERTRWLQLVETFYHVHDQLGIGLIITDGPRPYYANDAFRRTVGLDLPELQALPSLIDLVCEDDRATVAEDFGAMIRGDEPMRERQVCLVHRSGEEVPVDVFIAIAPSITLGGPPRLVCLVQPRPRQSS